MTKRIVASILILFILVLTDSPAHHAKAKETQEVTILEPESEACCKTDLELMENLNSALLAKKSLELQQNQRIGTSSSQIPYINTLYQLMPSTGEVKMLVLPIAFPDFPEVRDSCDVQKLDDLFFAEYDPDKEPDRQSVRGFYDWASYGKMKISGTVLPLHEMPKTSEYYKTGGFQERDECDWECHNAIQYYIDSGILSLEDYDGDGDGYVDSLFIIPLEGYRKTIWLPSMGLMPGKRVPENDNVRSGCIFNNTETKLPCNFAFVSPNYLFGPKAEGARIPINLSYQLMGLNYNINVGTLPENLDPDGTSLNTLNSSLLDVANEGLYINVYFKWLLGWIEPTVLTNKDLVFDETKDDTSAAIDLYAVENYTDGQKETKAVVWIPDPEFLPFTEFFIAEYRAGVHIPTLSGNPQYCYFEEDPGIVIWHCNTFLTKTGHEFRTHTSYLQPVRKTKSADYTSFKDGYERDDIYRKGDIFSSDSQPANSNFYNEDYTGAYMEVLDITSEKATIKAGFRDPDLSPPPLVELSEPSKKTLAYKYPWDELFFNFSASYKGEPVKPIYTNGEVETAANRQEDSRFLDFCKIHRLEDDLTYGVSVNFTTDPWEISVSLVKKKESDPFSKEDGSYVLKIQKGWLIRNGHSSDGVTSEVFYIDTTPPEIKLQGTTPQIIERGEAYTELGAEVTDNLDPDIKAGKLDGKLEIDSSQVNTAKCGTYTVTYTATDHAGNKTTVEREVIVQDTIAPTATVSYSTLAPTSGDVVATITPSEPVTVTNTENGSLSYTFTENGRFTFEFEDEAGNKGKATATVSNIDKSLPTGTVSYDVTGPTNQDVTATLIVDPTITILNNGGSNTHVFTENGSFEFELQNAAGTKGTVAATVTWIDKEAPTATVTYSPHKLTNQDVTATITPSEEVTVTSEGGLNHTFAENGSFTFEFEDKAGNKGTAIAAVDWIDKEPPVITLLGDNPLSLKLGEEYVEPGVEVTDNRDEEIESKLEIDASAVDTETAGTYAVKYSATDGAGNHTEAIRTVKVVNPNASVPIVPTPVLELPFTDVAKGTWYYDPISYAYNNGLFAGLTETEFGPDVSTSRAMLASILYRLEGKPEITKLSPFEDVPAGRYYSEAIAWAVEQGIVAGYDETHFGPDDPITREQLVSMLYRYAGSPETNGSLEKFTDSGKASRYAKPALCWAVETGILSGKGGGILDPKGKATRAEAAAMLMRYCEK